MKSLKKHSENAVYHDHKTPVFQRKFLLYTRIYRATFIGCMLFLSACHPPLSSHKMLSSLDKSTRIKHANKHTITASLSAIQHARILQIYGGAYHDVKLKHLLANIVHKLTLVSQNSYKTYSVTILNSESINAFAHPHGSIYITRGMLALANDPSEVAAVLAHEIAHITANHSILRLQKKAELQMTSDMSSPSLSFNGRKLYPPLKNRKQLAQFSRNQELEADSIALEMLQQAGYDPFASPRFLQSMEAYSIFRNLSNTTNASLDFPATHPTTPERIRLARKKAYELSTIYPHKINRAQKGNIDHDSFLKSISGMVFWNNFHTGFVRGNEFIHPQLRIAFSVPDNFIIENSTHTVWASGPDKIAIRFDALSRPSGISASDYLKSGRIIGLDETSIHPITIQGFPGAHARAANEQWQFDVVVIVFNKHIFRFLTAAPHHFQNFEAIAQRTVESFHSLSYAQLKKLKPLKIRIIRVQEGESIADLAHKMQNPTHKEKLFRILNGLSPTQTLHAGTKVKIITE
ncbi:M48 family metalloprotease [Bartonella rattaustraliani]|uniref:M48 family metalloprotease n=1 Tax=Bartonella rattaustraliani TaxID=481139 RepID=UPI0004755DAA|nr:M48 family metalloprotease [Bartonella rattaustraliani]